MQEEAWKSAVGFEGMYEVSDLGGVRRLETTARGRCLKLRTLPAALLKQHRNHAGYAWITLSGVPGVDGIRKKSKKVVHRLVAEAFLGQAPSEAHQINHLDGNKENNRLSNLEWVTPKENMRHASAMGLLRPQSPWTSRRRGGQKLAPEDVILLRNMYAEGELQRTLAARFGVSAPHISSVVNEKSWVT